MSALVSIIIPCYNAERWVGEAIECCLGQTHSDIEIVVVNDGSTDGSHTVIQNYANSIQYAEIPHQGASAARNVGFRMASGKFIQYLDADDLITEKKIERQLAYLQKNNADVVYSDWRVMDSDRSRCLPIKRRSQYSDFVKLLLDDDRTIPNMAYLYRRAIIERCGGWDEDILVEDDHFFNFKIAFIDARMLYMPGCDSLYRKNHALGLSSWELKKHGIEEALTSITRLYERAEDMLTNAGRMNIIYAESIIKRYECLILDWNFLDQAVTTRLLERISKLRQLPKQNLLDHEESRVTDKLMVVAHPDDECIFGGAQLLQESGWKVVCLTNFQNEIRRREFLTVTRILGCRNEMWDYPDEIFTPFEDSRLRLDLNRVLSERKWRKVVTHNQYGEYGHPHHIQLNRVMTEIVGKNLWYFTNNGPELPKEIWQQKLALIETYSSQTSAWEDLLHHARRESIENISSSD